MTSESIVKFFNITQELYDDCSDELKRNLGLKYLKSITGRIIFIFTLFINIYEKEYYINIFLIRIYEYLYFFYIYL